MFWKIVYIGPHLLIIHAAGRITVSNDIRANGPLLHVCTKAMPVELAKSMVLVERYHFPLIRAYIIIPKEYWCIAKEELLQLVVTEVNDSVEPKTFVPTLLVLRTLHRSGPCLPTG